MGNLYDDLKPVATSLLKEFGQGIIKYVDITPATGNDADEPGTPTETEYTVDGAASGVKFKYVQNGFALATDLQVTLSTSGVNDATSVTSDIIPTMKGFIKVDGVKYKIVEIIPKPAAGITIANVVIIRK